MFFYLTIALLISIYSCQQSFSCFTTQTGRCMTGGVKQYDVFGLQSCLSRCLSQRDCLSVDFNCAVSPNECWIFTRPGNLYSCQAVNHYERVCGIAGMCFSKTPDSNMNGGIAQTGCTSLDSCASYCVGQQNCMSFDFNSLTNQCWTISATTNGNLNSCPGVDHYVRQQCGVTGAGTGVSCLSWSEMANTNSAGGTLMPQANSLDACKSTCMSYGCAFGFDFMTSTGQCWISTSSSTGFASGVCHYTCGSACPSWSQMANTNSPGGNLMPQANSLDACKSTCMAYGCAYGFDFVSSTGQCWISTSSSTGFASGVCHFTCGLKRTCTYWREMDNTNSAGGQLYPATCSIDDCKKACMNSGCTYGFDFLPSTGQCWISTSSVTGTTYGVKHVICVQY